LGGKNKSRNTTGKLIGKVKGNLRQVDQWDVPRRRTNAGGSITKGA